MRWHEVNLSLDRGVDLPVQHHPMADAGLETLLKRPLDEVTHEIADQELLVIAGKEHVE